MKVKGNALAYLFISTVIQLIQQEFVVCNSVKKTLMTNLLCLVRWNPKHSQGESRTLNTQFVVTRAQKYFNALLILFSFSLFFSPHSRPEQIMKGRNVWTWKKLHKMKIPRKNIARYFLFTWYFIQRARKLADVSRGLANAFESTQSDVNVNAQCQQQQGNSADHTEELLCNFNRGEFSLHTHYHYCTILLLCMRDCARYCSQADTTHTVFAFISQHQEVLFGKTQNFSALSALIFFCLFTPYYYFCRCYTNSLLYRYVSLAKLRCCLRYQFTNSPDC